MNDRPLRPDADTPVADVVTEDGLLHQQQHVPRGGEEGLGGLGPSVFWLFLALPAGGLLVGWLTQRFAPEAEGHGTEQMVRTFHDLGGRVRRRARVAPRRGQ